MLENVVVRIERGVSTAVGARKPGEAVTHDLGDVTLLPGLIDSHTHLIGGDSQARKPTDRHRQIVHPIGEGHRLDEVGALKRLADLGADHRPARQRL